MDPADKLCVQAIMNMPDTQQTPPQTFANALMPNTHTWSYAQVIQASTPKQHDAANRKVRRELGANEEEEATTKYRRTSRYEPILELKEQFFGSQSIRKSM
eukprot:2390526-Rhodomonas_salina.1